MCGLAGFISKNFTTDHLTQMNNAVKHRGPDAEGLYYNQVSGVGLSHRRLSILDLSEAANQPFYSADGRYVMVYNGEVYNFKEIAKKYNIKCKTISDTEVILETFAKVGINGVNDFIGMFTIIIWDKQEEKLYLIRDRIGIKPLYYYQNGKDFAFASELKSLFVLPIKKTIEKIAIANFLYLGYIPVGQCIYSECKKLKPGYYAMVHNGNLTLHCYWKLEDKIAEQSVTDEKAAKDALRNLLESSVDYCMVSDVPVGIFLSGGVDSSTIAAIAQSNSKHSVKTFSIGFKEKKFNESAFASKIAEHINSDHHEFVVSKEQSLHLIDQLPDIYDEPYGDSSAIPTLLVSKLARQYVTVALSGDGGDELFLGYGFYTWARRLSHPLIKNLRKPLAVALNAFGNNRMKRASQMFRYPAKSRIKSHIFSHEQNNFSQNEIASLLKEHTDICIEENLYPHKRKLKPIEQQSFFDIKNYLPEELLVKVDRASMFHSIEVRVPLLDHRLVEFAINLSPDLKLKNKTGKYLLKQVLFDYIPASYFDRPKRGFSIPLSFWLKNELRYLLDHYLSNEVLVECNLVSPPIVKKLINNFFAGSDYLYTRLWLLVILHKWYKEKHL